ncbi:hypothetical protein WME89_26055 [Sorangium sp. So ce321]|uniref:hypothetical protein n=1 Tax=Sorangium sp. So ce321 TaxID=3133300 RepID=UPI003F5DD752
MTRPLRRSARRARLREALLAGALLVTGCSSSQLTVSVRSTKDTNQRRPLYMLVRSVDAKTYLAEAYASAADKVITPDASVLDAQVVFPGVQRDVEVKKPGKTPVAVYFFFTNPTGRWKMLIEQPLPGRVDIQLGVNQVETQGGGE